MVDIAVTLTQKNQEVMMTFFGKLGKIRVCHRLSKWEEFYISLNGAPKIPRILASSTIK